ncbi:MAG: substrate-binding domain-containing protein [Gemmatimonadales bacterium]|nr:substrate-binding domain-containing protein [Gemmatimonadales bacterium]
MPALLLLALLQGAPQNRDVVLATTTSTRDAGLLDTLLPVFETNTGYRVRVVAVGSGQALELGRRGDADVVLSHAPAAEQALVDSGLLLRRRRVMHNDFILVGPPEDPAGLRGGQDAVAAVRRLADERYRFVSRGDRSGTHQLEQRLWRAADLAPAGPWYLDAGQGMAATLQIADQKEAYTLTDRATYLAWRDKLHLAPLVEGDSLLYNVYHVMETKGAGAGARALADFLVSSEAQAIIARFGMAQFGRPLFFPALEGLIPPNR